VLFDSLDTFVLSDPLDPIAMFDPLDILPCLIRWIHCDVNYLFGLPISARLKRKADDTAITVKFGNFILTPTIA